VTKKSRAPMQLSLALTGDQRFTENVILEVRALAQRFGLEIPSIKVVRRRAIGAKTAKATSRRKRG
jgi:hypothetical protein